MKYIRLTNSKLRYMVDDEDYERCKAMSCYQHPKHKTVSCYIGRENNISVQIPLANFIMQTKLMYDHKGRDYLNFQKDNLRPCNHSQNNANRAKCIPNVTSSFKGVSFRKDRGTWRASISVDNKSIHLGIFDSESKAAKAYNRAAVKYFGEFAVPNKIEVQS